jgi:hypothetical protein
MFFFIFSIPKAASLFFFTASFHGSCGSISQNYRLYEGSTEDMTITNQGLFALGCVRGRRFSYLACFALGSVPGVAIATWLLRAGECSRVAL